MSRKLNPYFAEFADDCFAECEEHLTAIRRGLLELEKFVDQSNIDKSLLDELLRRFHSLKGLSGMIGMKESELLAHNIENFFKTLAKGNVVLSQDAVGKLIDGTKHIERVISSYQMNTDEEEDFNAIIEQMSESLKNLSKGHIYNSAEKSNNNQGQIISFQGLKESEMDKVNSAFQRGESVFRIEFIPSSELFSKGININSIRTQLQEIGEIIHSAPANNPEGKLSFEIIFSTSNKEQFLTNFAKDKNYLLINEYEHRASGSENQKAMEKEIKVEPQTFSTSNVVRVEMSKLDDLMRMVGELVITRARLDDALKMLEDKTTPNLIQNLQEVNQSLEHQLRDLRQGVMRVRLVPIGEVFERMQFVVRDLIRESKKSINLQIIGKETEIDKYVVERILDPLLHLVRNSVSHGIESMEERVNKGKNPQANLILRAYTSGDAVIIEIEDDGKGIQKKKVINKALEQGLISPQTLIDDNTILNIICSPGFSTKDEADLVSGRGVGMSVVKKMVQELGGSLDLETQEGKGTKFIINLPLTLAIVDALILSVGSQTFALPQPVVNEVIQFNLNDIKNIENNEIITYRGRVLPIIQLNKYFDIQRANRDNYYALVVGNESSSVGISVDKVIGIREVVVRSLSDPLINVTGLSGATELGDGKVVLILDAPAIIRAVKQTKVFDLINMNVN